LTCAFASHDEKLDELNSQEIGFSLQKCEDINE